MSRHHRTRPTSIASAFLFALVAVIACGSLAAWTPAPDGLVGFLFVLVLLLGWIGAGTGSGHGRTRDRGHSRPGRRSRRR